MVAIVTASGLGLFNASSLTSTASGSGRAGERIAVNTATGNLVIQDTDERLSALGLDIALVRTYNSLGLMSDDNGDNWRLGVHQRVYGLTGTANTAGSTVTKTFGDGAEVKYTYSAALLAYVSSDGEAAHDTLSWNASTSAWTWTDGSSRNTETYNSAGQLLNTKDTDGNIVIYAYTGSLLTSITDASGQATRFVYTGNNLTRIDVVSNGVTQTHTRYFYDSSNRLTQVVVDLTPENAADAVLTDANLDGLYETVNGKSYVTTYTYDSTSKRVASIIQGDGTSVAFTYLLIDGQYRLRTHTVNDGATTRTTTFAYTTYNAGGSVYLQTDVTDPLNFITTYQQDVSGRIISILSPTVNGVRQETRYSYDTNGNLLTVTEDPAGLNRVTTNTYDANDNVLTSRDSAGNSTSRTYSATNQLLTETRYLVRDPDGAGTGQPSAPVTTRYAYDTEDHLRFVIDADGRVTEHRYNTAGQRILTLRYTGTVYSVGSLTPATALTESQMTTWIGTQDLTKLERLDYAYDFRGQVSSITSWNATVAAGGAGTGTPSITRFTYDQRGNLLSTTEARGEATTTDATDYRTTYIYDGFGRLLTKSEWITAGNTRVTSTQYDDVGNRTVTTQANGLITTSTYNKAGELTSLINTGPGSIALGTSTYKYDANGRLRLITDPSGVRQFYFYDEAGRKIGEASGNGTLTEFLYNKINQPIKTIKYASALSATTLGTLVDASGNPTNIAFATIRPAANANDQITRAVYNNAGQVVYTIDAIGAVTEMIYDGAGHVTDTIGYFNTVTIPATTNEVLPGSFIIGANSANDRRTRYFYDNVGNQIGALNAEGYLTENLYDAGGHLKQVIAYANQSPSAQWTSGTLTALRPAPDNETIIDPEQDSNTYFYYDGQGRLVGILDAEGYLTETVYDIAGRVAQSIRYDQKLTWSATATLASLKAAVPAAAIRHTNSFQYDGVGQLTQETNFEGTNITYVYDGAGKVISSTRAQGTTEARTTQARYDALGRVTQELTGEGSAAITAGMTQAQIDTIWNQYGVKYTYDSAGRRTSTSDQNNNKTVFYYDNDGNLRFTVNGQGEVTENRFDALGQLTDTLTYANRIASSGLAGGLLTSALITQLTPTADTVHDGRTTYTYATGSLSAFGGINGRAVTTTTTEGAQTVTTANVYGETVIRSFKRDATTTRTEHYGRNRLGLLTGTIDNYGSANVRFRDQLTYDAFGRLRSYITSGGTAYNEYDRLGRTIATVDPFGIRRLTAYDAFSRTLTIKDGLSNTTTYVYNDTTREMTVTTPESIQVKTAFNRHGQKITLTAAGNTTTYTYDLNGNVINVSDSLGALETRAYDKAGRLVTSKEGAGNVVRFEYDNANRVINRIVDPKTIITTNDNPNGLELKTSYQYDGQGRVILVTEPSGRVTKTEYDNDGHILEVAVDPSGLNLRTQYTYDLEGRIITVAEGVTSTGANVKRTQYIYDAYGRRIEEIIDPTSLGGTLNLRTQYKYDLVDNVTRKIDANGNSTWYVYDANKRVVQMANQLGVLTVMAYDAENRLTSTRTYYNMLPAATVAGFGDVVPPTIAPPPTHTLDRIEQTVYDKDGRAVYSINGIGTVTERTFDANGNVTRTRIYAKRIAMPTYHYAPSTVQSALTSAGNSTTTVSPLDRLEWNTFDLRGRRAYRIDGAGAVCQYQYDLNGNVIAKTDFATPRATNLATDLASLNTFASSNSADTRNQTTRYWYDNANRARFSLDAEGYLHETRYSDSTRERREILYMAKPTIAAGAAIAQVVTAGTAIANSAKDQITTTLLDAAGRLSRVTNAEGFRTDYVYDAKGNIIETRVALNTAATITASVRHYFDAASRETYTLSAEGYLTVRTYDSVGNLKTHTIYDTPVAVPSSGVPTPAVGDNGHTTTFEYDAQGHKIFETNAAGIKTAFGYDTRGNLLSIMDAYGSSSARIREIHAYDAADRLTDITKVGDATYANLTTHYDLDAFGNVTARYDAYGLSEQRRFDYLYDGDSRMTSETNVALAATTVTAYDAFGNVITETEASSTSDARVSVFVYDRRNQAVKETRAPDETIEYIRDAAGNVTGTINANAVALTTSIPLGTTDEVTYYQNLRKRLGVIDTATGQGKTVAQLTATDIQTLKNACTTTSVYDRTNRVVSVTSAEGITTRYVYDGAGNKTDVYEASGRAGEERHTIYAYDRDGHLTRVTDPTGGYTQYRSYDAFGNAKIVVDANNYTRTNTYDSLGRLLTSTTEGGRKTVNTYDVFGNLDTVTTSWSFDGSDARVTSYKYDVFNRVYRETNGESYTTTTLYDSFGNKKSITTGQYLIAVGQAGYDAAKAGLAAPMTTTFIYNALNEIKTMTDALGRVTSYDYDLRGNQKTVTEMYGTNRARATGYAYDKANRLTATLDPMGGRTETVYDKAGNVIYARTLQRYTYTAAAGTTWNTIAATLYGTSSAWPSLIAYFGLPTQTPDGAAISGTSTLQTAITFQSLPLILNPGTIIPFSLNTANAAQVWSKNVFEYDKNNRRTAAIDPLSTRTEYQYDAVGNVTQVRYAVGTTDARSIGMEYDLNNRKTADIDGLNNRTTYVYDKLGNRTKVTNALNKIARYYYNGNSELTCVLDPEGVINAFSYDSVGNRIRETLYATKYTGTISDTVAPSPTASSGSDRIHILTYDGNSHVKTDRAADGTRTDYTYDGNGKVKVEKRFANLVASRTVLYDYDAVGRLIKKTDVDGAIINYGYNDFGDVITETLTSPSTGVFDPISARESDYDYDAMHRRIKEYTDPAGVAIINTRNYDLAGNLILEMTNNFGLHGDFINSPKTYGYDAANRLVSENSVSGSISYLYDRVGNRTRVIDQRSYFTDYTYDKANRLTDVYDPQDRVYVVANGTNTSLTGRGHTVNTYDAVGNIVQITRYVDTLATPTVFKTTRWYDGNGRMIAELTGNPAASADNVLCGYGYNAFGELIQKTEYMATLNGSAHNPAIVPTGSAATARVTDYQYDLGGRLTQVTLPGIMITRVTDNGTDATSVASTVRPTERHTYDAYGQEVETFDRNGARAVNYYDVKGRKITAVDAAGYVTEWDYDTVGNVLEERRYNQPISVAGLSTATRPVMGEARHSYTDYIYDGASRMVAEILSNIATEQPGTDGQWIVGGANFTTRYTYDNKGNVLTKTIGADTPEALTEYFYYDSDSRLIAHIDAKGVLTYNEYDGASNRTREITYFADVSQGGSIDFGTMYYRLLAGEGAIIPGIPFQSDFSLIDTKMSTFIYDSRNRVTQEVDVMSYGGISGYIPTIGTGLTKQYMYDLLGNSTRVQDEDLGITTFDYDAKGRITKTITPDNTPTVFQYDAAGNLILTYTNANTTVTAVAPTNITAATGNLAGQPITINWQTATAGQRAWVVYGTASSSAVAGYAYRSQTVASIANIAGTPIASTTLDQLPAANNVAGTTVYFRVVTQDASGDLAWSAEQSVVIPPRLSSVAIKQATSGNTLTVNVRFEGTVTTPQLFWGTAGAVTTAVTLTAAGDGSYQASFTPSSPTSAYYAIQWKNASGATFRSVDFATTPVTDRVGITTLFNPAGGSGTINASVQIPQTYASSLSDVTLEWRPSGTSVGFNEVAAWASSAANGLSTYSLSVGPNGTLAAGPYEVLIAGTRSDGTRVVLQSAVVVVSATSSPTLSQSASLETPRGTDSSVVLQNGRTISVALQDGRLLIGPNPALNTGTSASYDVYYTQQTGFTHSLLISVSSTGNATVQATLSSSSETATINSAGLRLAWRPAASGINFTNNVAIPGNGNGTVFNVGNVGTGSFDYKVYYIDTQGREVILRIVRLASGESTSTTGAFSLRVLGREAITVSNSAAGIVSASAGLYNGNVDLAKSGAGTVTLTTSTTSGSSAGSLNGDGLNQGYYQKNEYNALNYKTASTGNDGIWRLFYVDANGNVVQQKLIGTDRNATVSYDEFYKIYDGRNRVTAEFGGLMPNPTNPAAMVRPIVRYTYNHFNQVLTKTDPRSSTWITKYTYNDRGMLETETDALNGVTKHTYDQFGHETSRTNPRNLARLIRYYDRFGRLVHADDLTGANTYVYDYFDRKTAEDKDGSGTSNTKHFVYDHRDRLISEKQAMLWHMLNDNATIYQNARSALGYSATTSGLTGANIASITSAYTTTYAYNGRNLRTQMNGGGKNTVFVYDSMGRLIETQLTVQGIATKTQTKYDVYGNIIEEIDAEGQSTTYYYGDNKYVIYGFGRVQYKTDPSGNGVGYEYDKYGHMTREYGLYVNKNITRTYDQLGRVLTVSDSATGVNTTYTYDLAGNRLTEIINTPVFQGATHNRNYVYTYDALNRMTRWKDNVTGIHENIEYDADGNKSRVYTDTGWTPYGTTINYRYTDNIYKYDYLNRLTSVQWNRPTEVGFIAVYSYDGYGNRRTWTDYHGSGSNISSITWTYTFDANGRVAEGVSTQNNDGVPYRQTWAYDARGNVVVFFDNRGQTGALGETFWTRTTYNEADRAIKVESTHNVGSTIDPTTTTTYFYDKAQRVKSATTSKNGTQFKYNYSYNGNGTEFQITTEGGTFGSPPTFHGTSTSFYNSNFQRTKLDLGKDNSQVRNEVKQFLYDNEGHVLFMYRDDGRAISGANRETHEYVYANGNPMGETLQEVDQNGLLTAKEARLDAHYSFNANTHNTTYAPYQNYGSSYPGTTVDYVVRAGETLISIASNVYGNPSLWYVIADANGLSGTEPLTPGMTLRVPATSDTGSITSLNHNVYNEGRIAGSGFPNLYAKPPALPDSACASALAILVTVVIAVAASVATGGIGAALGGTLLAYAGAGAGVGAVAGFAANASQQGIYMGYGLQEDFDWSAAGNAAAFGALSGVLSGAAMGVGEAASASARLGALSETNAYGAQIGAAFLEAGSNAVQQLGQGGEVSVLSSVLASGLGGYSQAAGAIARGGLGTSTFDDIAMIGGGFATPWIQAAETYSRTGQLVPADWMSATGSSLSVITSSVTGASIADRLTGAGLRMTNSLFIAGAFGAGDAQAATNYLAASAGREIGLFAGGYLAEAVMPTPATLNAEMEREYYNYSRTDGWLAENEAGDSGPLGVVDVTGAVYGDERDYQRAWDMSSTNASNKESIRRLLGYLDPSNSPYSSNGRSSYIDESADDLRRMPEAVTPWSLMYHAAKGAVMGLYGFKWITPATQIFDVGQALGFAGMNLYQYATNQPQILREPDWISPVGQALKANPSMPFYEAMIRSLPVVNLPYAIKDTWGAVERGDWNTVVESTVAMTIGYTKLGKAVLRDQYSQSRTSETWSFGISRGKPANDNATAASPLQDLTGIQEILMGPAEKAVMSDQLRPTVVGNDNWAPLAVGAGEGAVGSVGGTADFLGSVEGYNWLRNTAANDNAMRGPYLLGAGSMGGTPGFPVPFNTGATRGAQLPEDARLAVDNHLHLAGLESEGYNNFFQGRMRTPDFLREAGNTAMIGQIPQSFQNCCPANPYYIGYFETENGRTLNEGTANVRIYSNGEIWLPERSVIVGPDGRPMAIDPMQLNPSMVGLNARSYKELVPHQGHVDVPAWFVPDGMLELVSIRQKDTADMVLDLAEKHPDLSGQVLLGFTDVQPSNPGAIDRFLNPLAYVHRNDPNYKVQVFGNGEWNLASKEVVENSLDINDRFDWNNAGALKEYLQWSNDNIPGMAMVVHMDASAPIEFGVGGQPFRVLLGSQMKYSKASGGNVEQFIELTKQYPNLQFIWAHGGGISRSGDPAPGHTAMLRSVLQSTDNVSIDLSWDIVAQKIVRQNANFLNSWAGPGGQGIVNEFPTRFLYGSDAVAPKNVAGYFSTLKIYEDSGLLGNLTERRLFLRENALRIVNPAVQSIFNYRRQHNLELLIRPLPPGWVRK